MRETPHVLHEIHLWKCNTNKGLTRDQGLVLSSEESHTVLTADPEEAPSSQVVFFTNQMGITRGKLKPEDFKFKVENILKTLQLPIQVGWGTHACTHSVHVHSSLYTYTQMECYSMWCVCVQVFVASGPGVYRKPVTGMWEHLSEKVRQTHTPPQAHTHPHTLCQTHPIRHPTHPLSQLYFD